MRREEGRRVWLRVGCSTRNREGMREGSASGFSQVSYTNAGVLKFKAIKFPISFRNISYSR